MVVFAITKTTSNRHFTARLAFQTYLFPSARGFFPFFARGSRRNHIMSLFFGFKYLLEIRDLVSSLAAALVKVRDMSEAHRRLQEAPRRLAVLKLLGYSTTELPRTSSAVCQPYSDGVEPEDGSMPAVMRPNVQSLFTWTSALECYSSSLRDYQLSSCVSSAGSSSQKVFVGPFKGLKLICHQGETPTWPNLLGEPFGLKPFQCVFLTSLVFQDEVQR